MTTIHEGYVNALLADAAYVSDLKLGMTGTALTDKLSTRMTLTYNGEAGNYADVIYGSFGSDHINDQVNGLDGNWALGGSTGNDYLEGNVFAFMLSGRIGNPFQCERLQ